MSQTNQQPNVFTAGSHSVGQLWDADYATPNGLPSTAETGWTEAPGQYPDVQTHLFAAMSDCGVYPGNGGYVGINGISWVQVSPSVYPNMVITHDDTTHVYAVEAYQGSMWFDYDGSWYGYIPGGAWGCHFPFGDLIQFGGEVATPEYQTCTDMGNGLFGTQANSATVTDSNYYSVSPYHQGPTSIQAGYMSDQPQYNVGQWAPTPGQQVDAFHYGGPGWC
ncbi:MAG TPA: hypothetical protein VG294_13730 [Solirubrobacteraceae bacterium]|jgi:hypothetical protein|nr:hypothetical protein [Solirubrobacteraceae bacterium]